MNLMQLYYFRALAKTEHYTHAAEELDISQSALSQSISSLENELQTYLFEKKGRNIVLTKNGRLFFKYVDSALNELDKGKKELKKINTLEDGKISLGFISGVGHFVPGLISDFLKKPSHVNISFTCAEGTTDVLIRKLKDEYYDMIMCSKNEDEQNIDFVPIIEGQLVVLVPEAHPLVHKKKLYLNEISTLPFIIHTSDCGMRTLTDELFARLGVKPKIVMEAQEDMLIAELVESNHGIALITDMPEIKKFRIKIIPLADPDAHRFIYLASLKNHHLSPAARAFKTFLLDRHEVTPLTAMK